MWMKHRNSYCTQSIGPLFTCFKHMVKIIRFEYWKPLYSQKYREQEHSQKCNWPQCLNYLNVLHNQKITFDISLFIINAQK